MAPDTAWLNVARIIAGIAIGVASFLALLYISEIAPVEIRGKLVSINQIALTSGIVISYLVDHAFDGSGGVALEFAMAVIPRSRIWNWTDFCSRSPAMAGRPRALGSTRAVLKRIRPPGKVEGEPRPGTSG